MDNAVTTLVKPRFRGTSHQYAFIGATVAGIALTISVPASARIAVGIYALSLMAMFGASALYHRGPWTDAQRVWFRRLDHSMIFVLVAGTYTPFASLVIGNPLGTIMLAVVWTGALAGILVTLFWIDAPAWVTALIYVVLGWISVVMLPELLDKLGWMPIILLGAGGVLYTIGAVVYARKKPDPVPHIFGYHEVFHVFVIAAAAVQFLAVALYAT